jgi:hypothetical protein
MALDDRSVLDNEDSNGKIVSDKGQTKFAATNIKQQQQDHYS